MAGKSEPISTFLQSVSSYIQKALPLLPAYKRGYRTHIRDDVIHALQAFATLAVHVSPPPEGGSTPPDVRAKIGNLLMLEGSLPIARGGAEKEKLYVPVQVWLLPGYPQTPPEVFVQQSRALAVKPGHKVVDVSGLCQVAGFRQGEWSHLRSNLRALLESLQRVFGADPPLLPRQWPQPRPARPDGEPRELEAERRGPGPPSPLSRARSPGPFGRLSVEVLEPLAQRLAAEDGALEDAMWRLVDELAAQAITTDAFTKGTRQLATEQFGVRARLVKATAALEEAAARLAAERGRQEAARRRYMEEGGEGRPLQQEPHWRALLPEQQQLQRGHSHTGRAADVAHAAGRAAALQAPPAGADGAGPDAELARKIEEDRRRLEEVSRRTEEAWRRKAEERQLAEEARRVAAEWERPWRR